MTILNFPQLPGIIYPVKRVPTWSTIKQDAVNGRRTRLAQWPYNLWKYTIGFSMLRSDSVNLEWQQLVGFYNKVKGPAGVWYWLDGEDYQVTDMPIGVTDGTTGPFQLTRTLGGAVEPVFAPALITNVKVAGSAVTIVLGQYGQFTIAGSPPAPGQQITWTGTYLWLAQFDDDTADFDNFMYQYWELQQISFTTWRP